MRYINKTEIHEKAVNLLRKSKNKMKRTGDRLAACNVDNQINDMLKRLKSSAWELPDHIIIEGLAKELIIEFCQAEINLQSRV